MVELAKFGNVIYGQTLDNAVRKNKLQLPNVLSLPLCTELFLTQLSSSRDTAMNSEFVFYEFSQIL